MKQENSKYCQYLKENIKILDVCKMLNIDVRRFGDSYMCKCPKHSDENPSLCIYPTTNPIIVSDVMTQEM